MDLRRFVETVYLPSRVEVSAGYAGQLRAVVARLEQSLGRTAKLTDLRPEPIARYLSTYRASWSARSTNNQRQLLLTLWQAAADRDWIAPPRRSLLRKIPEQRDVPEAWTAEEVSLLITYCRGLDGMMGTVPACSWWESLFQATYYTAARIGSLLAAPASAYRPGGLLLRRQKNRRAQWHRLPPACCAAIERTRPARRKLLWPLPWRRRQLWSEARRIIVAAGLPAPGPTMDIFHRLRRTALSYCAAVDPALAQRTAGHASYQTTLRSYIDPRLLQQETSAADVLPPLVAPAPALRVFG